MDEIIKIILASGKSGLDLGLYVLLPVLVVLMAVMKVIEAKGILALLAKGVEPLLKAFGVPGAGAFAMVQLLFVSFAAPLATLSIMEKDRTTRRQIAATLAMVFTMSQANVLFPLLAVGLDFGVILLTSVVGGLFAAALTYYVFARSMDHGEVVSGDFETPPPSKKQSVVALMIAGGQEGVSVIMGAIPIIILALFLVNLLKSVGGISLLEGWLSPLFGAIGFPTVAVLPLATKYLAGGTAMMGIVMELLKNGSMTVLEMNRMAGFLTNPCDIVGVAVLLSAGEKTASIARPAILGAVGGIVLRGVLHLILF